MQEQGAVSYTHLDVYKRQVDTSKATSISVTDATNKVTEQLKAANDIGAVDGKSTVTAGTACLLYTSRCV